MNARTLEEIEGLEELLNLLSFQIISNHPEINFGGCGVIAGIVGRKLEELGIGATVSIIDNTSPESWNIDDIRELITTNTIKVWNENGVHFSHLLLTIPTSDGGIRYWEAGRGVFGEDELFYPPRPGYLTVEETVELGEDEDPYGWNKCFDRSEIPELQRKVDEAFLKLGNSFSVKKRVA